MCVWAFGTAVETNQTPSEDEEEEEEGKAGQFPPPFFSETAKSTNTSVGGCDSQFSSWIGSHLPSNALHTGNCGGDGRLANHPRNLRVQVAL